MMALSLLPMCFATSVRLVRHKMKVKHKGATMSRQIILSITAVAMLSLVVCAAAEQPAPLSALAKMPIKEVTVFKDGHAFVLHEGKMPTDAAGDVLMDYLPTPVLGTFWGYSADKDRKLTSVVASQRLVSVEATALSIRELLESNV